MNKMDFLEYALGLSVKELDEEIKQNSKNDIRFNLLRGLQQGLEIANIIMTEDFNEKAMLNLIRNLIEDYQ